MRAAIPVLAVALAVTLQAGFAHEPGCETAPPEPADPWTGLAGVEAASSEADLLAAAQALTARKALAPESAEHARLAIATRLADLGTSQSLALLETWRAMPVVVWREEILCRNPVKVPAWPVGREAARAAWLIEERGWLARLAANGSVDEIHRAAQSGAGPAIAAAAQAVEELSVADRTALRTRLAAAHSLNPGEAALLGAVLKAGSEQPTAEELRRLSEPDLLALLQSRTAEAAPHRRDLLGAVEQARPELASAARAALGHALTGSARETLERLGDDAASLPLSVEELAPLLADADAAVRRRAVLALMAQDSAASRSALADAVRTGTLPEPMAGKVRAWLGL